MGDVVARRRHLRGDLAPSPVSLISSTAVWTRSAGAFAVSGPDAMNESKSSCVSGPLARSRHLPQVDASLARPEPHGRRGQGLAAFARESGGSIAIWGTTNRFAPARPPPPSAPASGCGNSNGKLAEASLLGEGCSSFSPPPPGERAVSPSPSPLGERAGVRGSSQGSRPVQVPPHPVPLPGGERGRQN